MSEANKAIVRRWIEEVWNKGNLAVLDQIFAQDYVGHAPPETMKGINGYKELVTKYRTAMPDLKFTIEEMVAEGDRVVTRWTFRGTNTGKLMGAAPTGKSAGFTGIAIVRFSGGRIAEEWANWDALGFMQQLGMVPKTGQAAAGGAQAG